MCIETPFASYSTPVKKFNITSNHPVGSQIGSIVTASYQNSLNEMQPPFYVVSLTPEDSITLERYISVDLETGIITLIKSLDSNNHNLTVFKFSVLSINQGTALNVIINVFSQSKTSTSHYNVSKSNKTKNESILDKKCIHLSLNQSMEIQNIGFDCLNLDIKPFSTRCNDNTTEWTGILIPQCNEKLNTVNFVFIDRLTIEKSDTSFNNAEHFINNNLKYPKNVEYNLNDDRFESIHEIDLDVKCKSGNNKFKLNIDFDKNLNELDKMTFMLFDYLNRDQENQIKSAKRILNYLMSHVNGFTNQSSKVF
jgi:hypothetical protein